MTTWLKEFDWNDISYGDCCIARDVLGKLRPPDFVISPDGMPYLYRWYVVKRSAVANVYFHIQVAHDPERPLHDHPWNNQSVILSGGYGETICQTDKRPTAETIKNFARKKGDVIWRKAEWSHRLFLPPGVPYTMTLFSTGPKIRGWGFWYEDKWTPYEDVTRVTDGQSVHIKPAEGRNDKY